MAGSSASPAPVRDSSVRTPAVAEPSLSRFIEDFDGKKLTNNLGWEVSRAEWEARRVAGVCQWCAKDHRTTNCPVQWEERKEEQMGAHGDKCLGSEKMRRRNNKLCVFCASPSHRLGSCVYKARAQAAVNMAKITTAIFNTKAARRAAWEAKTGQKAQSSSDEEK